MNKAKREDAPIRVYRPTWLIIASNCLIGLPLFSILAFLVWAFLERNMGRFDIFAIVMLVVIFVIQACLLWYLYILIFQTRLILYEDGLDLQQGSAHYFTNWENMSHFGGRSSGKAVQFGIYLHAPIQQEPSNFLERVSFGKESNFLPITYVMLMPRRWSLGSVTVDSQALSQTQFGRELLHYAPHLFEYGKEKAKNG